MQRFGFGDLKEIGRFEIAWIHGGLLEFSYTSEKNLNEVDDEELWTAQ